MSSKSEVEIKKQKLLENIKKNMKNNISRRKTEIVELKDSKKVDASKKK